MARNDTFIEYACRKISEYNVKDRNLHVVLPTLRLQRVLTDRLARMAQEKGQTPCFLPRFTTVNTLISRFSLLRKGENTELLALLYTVYRKHVEKEDLRTPDQFYDWGSMLISDFNAIDNQMAPAKDILQYTAEEKRIAQWRLDLNLPAGQLQNRYLKFYQKLWPIYGEYTQRLLEEGYAYTGLAGRTAAEKLPGLLQTGMIPPSDFYIFCGLNALTQAEKTIIKTLVQNGRAETVWNADLWYMDENSAQEAGHFLRQYRKDPDLNHNLKEEDFSDNLRRLPYRLVPCAQNTGQAKTAALMLAAEPDPSRTLVVLNDESLLAPLMNALPENIPCNLSIAGSLTGTRSGEFFYTLLQARQAVWQSANAHLKGDWLIQLLQNPLTGECAPKTDVRKLTQSLLGGHKNYFSRKDFRALFSQEDTHMDLCTEFIFDAETPRFFYIARTLCQHLLERAKKSERGKQQSMFGIAQQGGTTTVYDTLEIQFLTLLLDGCRERGKILEAFPDVDFGAQSMQKMLTELLDSTGINYMGNAREWLNITGMLETRGMAYDHVMMLSMNEGVMPAKTHDESFLLYSVKQYYGLPAEKEETAMAAHHFYSLLQNSRRTTLLYVSSVSDKNSEPSRFILQLQHEMPENEDKEGVFPYPFPLMHPQYTGGGALEIPKTPPLLQAVESWLCKKKVSYSALSQFLSCPAQFYYQRILGIEEPPQIAEELDVATKGSVFHSVMECFLSGRAPDKKIRLNRVLTLQDIDELLEQKVALVGAAMETNFPGGTYKHGVNHIAHREILFWVEREAALLRKEIENGKLIIKACEKRFYHTMENGFNGKSVTLTGVADRIDSYDDGSGEVLRIVDYKTGSVKNLNLEGESLEDNLELLQSGDGKQAFQLLMYLYLYQKEAEKKNGGTGAENTPKKVQAHICSVRTDARRPYADMYPLEGGLLENLSLKELSVQTENFLRTVFARMTDPAQAITATPGESGCPYCPYAPFCAI